MKEIFKDVADTLIQQLSEMNLADYTSRGEWQKTRVL